MLHAPRRHLVGWRPALSRQPRPIRRQEREPDCAQRQGPGAATPRSARECGGRVSSSCRGARHRHTPRRSHRGGRNGAVDGRQRTVSQQCKGQPGAYRTCGRRSRPSLPRSLFEATGWRSQRAAASPQPEARHSAAADAGTSCCAISEEQSRGQDSGRVVFWVQRHNCARSDHFCGATTNLGSTGTTRLSRISAPSIPLA